MKKCILSTLTASLLAACGVVGSGTSTMTTQIQADATLTQPTTDTVVMPGETFRILIGKTSCADDPNTGFCNKQVPLGEIGIKTNLSLSSVQFMLDGNQISGIPIIEQGSYRLFPIGYYSIWKQGMSLEVTGTLAPSTASGTTATIVLQSASAGIDQTLQVVPSSDSQIKVIAQANYAPAQIVVLNGSTPYGFQYSCPTTVTTGCLLQQFTMTVSGASNAEVRLYQNDTLIFQGWADASGSLSTTATGTLVYPGQSIRYHAEPVGANTVSFGDFESFSNDKQIAPLKPDGCTIVTTEACKG